MYGRLHTGVLFVRMSAQVNFPYFLCSFAREISVVRGFNIVWHVLLIWFWNVFYFFTSLRYRLSLSMWKWIAVHAEATLDTVQFSKNAHCTFKDQKNYLPHSSSLCVEFYKTSQQAGWKSATSSYILFYCKCTNLGKVKSQLQRPRWP